MPSLARGRTHACACGVPSINGAVSCGGRGGMGSSWDVNSGGGAESGEPAQERGGGARAESAVGRARSIKEQLESLSEISAPVVRLEPTPSSNPVA